MSIAGELAPSDVHEIAIRRTSQRAGELVVHFPREDYLVVRADERRRRLRGPPRRSAHHALRRDAARAARARGRPGAAAGRSFRVHREQHHLRGRGRSALVLELLPGASRAGAACRSGGSPTSWRRAARACARARASTATTRCRRTSSWSPSTRATPGSSTAPRTAPRWRAPTTSTARRARIRAPGGEEAQMLLQPLFVTAFLIDDYLAESALLRRAHGGALERVEQDGVRARAPARAARRHRSGRPHLAAQRRVRGRARLLRPRAARTARSRRSTRPCPRSSSTWPATARCRAPSTTTSARTSSTASRSA